MFNNYIITSRKDRCNYWCGVLIVNLILPGLFGLGSTEGAGRWGMLIAITLCCVIGMLAAWYHAFLSTVLIRGGCLVAISQLLVGFHLCLGLIAIGLGERFSSQPQRDVPMLDTVLSGFVATFFVGSVLMLLSVILGIMILGIFYLIFERSSNKGKGEESLDSIG